jgi:PRTRC genetic system protein E
MNFKQLAALGQGLDVVLRIKGKNGKLTVAVEPQLANASRLKPLVLTGTPEELDEGFIAQFDGLITTAKGLESNLAEVKKDAADIAAAAKSKPEPQGQAKKSPKPAPKKEKETKAKPAKKEKPVPAPGDMFSQTPSGEEHGGEADPDQEHEPQDPAVEGSGESEEESE